MATARTRATLHGSALGFRVWRRKPQGAMPAAHTHPDIELNFTPGGNVSYLHGGTKHTLAAGQLAVFWGGVPHQTLAPGLVANGIWLTLPLAWVLQWRLPGGFTERLLAGDLVQIPVEAGQVERWLHDYGSGEPERRRALLLELEACLIRAGSSLPAHPPRRRPLAGASQIERITAFLAASYREPLTVAAIARAVKLHPKYLMRVFKRHCGVSVWEYLTRLRISHAQRLLVTTDARVADIALESGFGSSAAFYQAFAAYAQGETPLAYRRRSLVTNKVETSAQ
jgi:AraC-like DNA-binding protein